MQRTLDRDAAHLPRELVPQGCGGQVSSGPASAKTCACSSGSSTARAAAPGPGNAHRLDAALRGHRLERPGLSRRRSSSELQAFDRAAWRDEVIGHEELFLDLHDHLPPEMIYERELLICRM